MSKHVITANRLGDGAVVYFRGPGDWTGEFAAARRIGDREALAQMLDVAEADVGARLVVGVYDLPVDGDADAAGGEAQPVSMREKIRAGGPTVTLPS